MSTGMGLGMTQQLHLEIWVQRLYPDVIWVLWQYSVGTVQRLYGRFQHRSPDDSTVIKSAHAPQIPWDIIVAKMKTDSLKLTLSQTHSGWFPNLTKWIFCKWLHCVPSMSNPPPTPLLGQQQARWV